MALNEITRAAHTHTFWPCFLGQCSRQVPDISLPLSHLCGRARYRGRAKCPWRTSPLDKVKKDGSSVRGILQTRILEWVTIPFSRGIFTAQGSSPVLLHGRCILNKECSEPPVKPSTFGRCVELIYPVHEDLGRSSKEPLLANLTQFCYSMERGKCRKSYLLGAKNLYINTCAVPNTFFPPVLPPLLEAFLKHLSEMFSRACVSIWKSHQKPQILILLKIDIFFWRRQNDLAPD